MVESGAGLQELSYLEESVKARLLLLTPDDCFLAHLKKVDKGRIALDQLSGLKEREKEEEKGWEGQGTEIYIHFHRSTPHA